MNSTELNKVALNELMDLLSEYTTTYTRLLAERKRGEEFNHSKSMIKLLLAEIEHRKSTADNEPGKEN